MKTIEAIEIKEPNEIFKAIDLKIVNDDSCIMSDVIKLSNLTDITIRNDIIVKHITIDLIEKKAIISYMS